MALHDHAPPRDAGIRVRARIEQRPGDLLQPARFRHQPSRPCDPESQRIAAPIRSQRTQRLDGQRIAVARALDVGARQQIQEPLRLRRMARGARHRHRRPGPARANQRQHTVPQIVAIQALVGVRLVLDPREAARAHPRFELGACTRQQRSDEPTACKGRDRRHGCQSRGAAATQQLQQHRLELIVLLVRSQQDLALGKCFRKQSIARLACGRLQ